MDNERGILTLDDSFKCYRNHDSTVVIVSDSEDENVNQDDSITPSRVIRDSSSPNSSPLAIESSHSYILENSQCAQPNSIKAPYKTRKLRFSDIADSRLGRDIFLVPDSDDDDLSKNSISKESIYEINTVDDSTTSTSKSDEESVCSHDISSSSTQIKRHSSSRSPKHECSRLSTESNSSASIPTQIKRPSSSRSPKHECSRLSTESNSSSSILTQIKRPSSSRSLKHECSRLSTESNFLASSIKVLELDTSSRSRDSNSSYSSQKQRSPCLTEKQKFAMKIEELANDIKKKKIVLRTVDPSTLPDRGIRLQMAVTLLEKDLKALKLEYENKFNNEVEVIEQVQNDQNLPTKDGSCSHGPSSSVNNLGVIRGMDSVTMEALQNLHDSLKTCPGEDIIVEQPVGLKLTLMPHQSHGLAWMLWREQQTPSGGILADDMGLGKTLSMISLVLKHKEDTGNKRNSESNGDPKGGTLVVCPTSLLGQWKGEIEKRCRQSALSVYVHHGADRTTSLRSLVRYDVVLTTYGIVQRECESISKKPSMKDDGPVHLVDWTRIILDEAHVVRNGKSKTSQAVSCLKGTYRWALTGTPIHNKELDLFALIVFLRCSPFDKYLVWRRWVDNKTAAGAQRMNMLMKSLMLRRTKDQLQSKGSLVCLPSRKEHHVEIVLDSSEQIVYDQILILSKTLFAKFMDQHAERVANQYNGTSSGALSNYSPISSIWSNPFQPGSALAAMQNIQDDRLVKSHHLLVLLLRLRQICCHPALIQSMLEAEDCKDGGIVDDSGLDVDLISQLNGINLLDHSEKEEEINTDDLLKNPLTVKNPVFKRERPSSKLNALLQCLEENVLNQQDKAVIVSQWTSMLDLIGVHLKQKGIKYQVLSGAVPLKARNEVIESFNNSQRGPKVLLLSLKAGGVGLNLVGGNHLMLVDLHWNPQLEAQACDRIYRVGQKKSVHIYRFVCLHTVEEKIHDLQVKKLSLAESVLTGVKNPQGNKLTMEDLKTLFSSH